MSKRAINNQSVKYLGLFIIVALYFSLCHTARYQAFMDEFFEYGSGMKLFKHGHFSESFFNHGIVNPIITEICASISGSGMSFFVARYCQLIMGAISLVATFYLALMFFPLKVAIISSLFFLISPYFNVSSHRILSENPVLLTFLLSLIYLIKNSRSGKSRYLICAGIFYALSIASKFYMLIYFPLFLVLSASEKTMKREVRYFYLNIVLLTYLFWLAVRLLKTGIYLIVPILLIILSFVYLIKRKEDFSNYIKNIFQDNDIIKNITVFFFSTLFSFIIIFPHIIFHFKNFLKTFFMIEITKETLGEGVLQFSPGVKMFPLSGYVYYLKEIYGFGLSHYLVILLLPGLLYFTFKAFKSNELLEYKKAWDFIALPAIFGFLVIGIWKVWYVRYMLHLFPLFSIIGALLLSDVFDYVKSIADNFKNSFRILSMFFYVAASLLFIVLFVKEYLYVYSLNKIRAADNGFFLMAEKLSKASIPGEKIGFKYWQAYSLDSKLYGRPYGSYPLLMYPINENVILEEVGSNEKLNDNDYDIIVTTSPEVGELILIDTASSERKVIENIGKYIFGFDIVIERRKNSDPAGIEKIIHRYSREGGGYPMNFWIYRNLK
ncbi:MAG: hypothetical protein A3C43_06500 [Candidatus Schekmanbacteria bacterium RIFCSPHIGHO2_02_FULL_38_11]|uniref:Glycosyltransferase RgtA/B/C/D-like domain-containing protein n=1 Tax=Candidatus Schekmanbacteria bacterium RIFCSPLOWO2_12_FULL_38_15 TaxID=1817883 RepID=A0A1F7SNZ0_9BACT|nr:MAG: hypothetical protein A2043_02225 [Candidatus Schekmanbacteria bacterium GWA2_38_9]OGL49531.1 MAG: hypothetical protein A3C43_06500 [Candidatus Schekmanbacteria bacterium RIFCSPHIGHO2_02_FULL_38_11]OGL50966.1 MAG: hypothetical protein A3H37_10830 [Candidatus Schekmanbacteria bacterium RIFCSPLOWO2_02_FULL_38_14]OGL54907.1 MAG: hypothetical protein A3G31_02180 [Candidatus Schekmanbacteria bacterium RIFCSPLOWO2_12_FULL_38_15]